MRKILIMLSVFAATGATANEVKLEGMYGTQESCAWFKEQQSGPITKFPKNFESFSYLDARGMRGWEWACDFLDAKSDQYGGQVITASCAAEGDAWPEMVLLQRNGKGYTIINKGPNGQPQATEFPVRCE